MTDTMARNCVCAKLLCRLILKKALPILSVCLNIPSVSLSYKDQCTFDMSHLTFNYVLDYFLAFYFWGSDAENLSYFLHIE